MGCLSGTEIFDKTMKAVLKCTSRKTDVQRIGKELKDALEDQDWDTQSESEYYDHPIIGSLFNHDE